MVQGTRYGLDLGSNSERTINEVANVMSQAGISFERKEYSRNPDFELKVTDKSSLELILEEVPIRSKLVRRKLKKAIERRRGVLDEG